MALVLKMGIGRNAEPLVIGEGSNALFVKLAQQTGRNEVKVEIEGPKEVRVRRYKLFRRDEQRREKVVQFPIPPNPPTPPTTPTPNRAA